MQPHSKTTKHQAFTLLEVILALAILAGALAALGEVVRLTGDHANRARDLSAAQLLAASKMAEITSGAVDLATVERAPLLEDTHPPWFYSIAWDPAPIEDLILVHVTVEQELPEDFNPVQFTLGRWLPDPNAISSSSSSTENEPSSEEADSETTR